MLKGRALMSEKREQWGSKFGMLMAAAGSAIGLGNIWRFPYITGKYGGAVFVLTYLIVVCLIGLSLMMAEQAIGRAGKSDAVGSLLRLGGKKWSIVGWMGFIVAFIILSYYAVIAGWTLAYFCGSVDVFGSLLQGAAQGKAAELFGSFVSNPGYCIAFFLVVMFVTATIVYRGIAGGVEASCKILMPTLFVILLMLVVRAVTLPGASKGISFYLKPDFAKLTAEGILAAIGQAFYSLSLAMGIMIVYGSYFTEDTSIPRSACTISLLDTSVAFLAGLVIFPSALAFGIEPNAGVALTFITLPSVFAQMPAGMIFSAGFFLLLFIAALTSCISLFEVAVAFGIDHLGFERKKSTVIMAILITLLGIPSALSVGGHFPKICGMDCLDFFDYVTNNLIMPIGGILLTIFAGWVWTEGAKAELTNHGKYDFKLYKVWLFICRIVAPIAIFVILAADIYGKFFKK